MKLVSSSLALVLLSLVALPACSSVVGEDSSPVAESLTTSPVRCIVRERTLHVHRGFNDLWRLTATDGAELRFERFRPYFWDGRPLGDIDHLSVEDTWSLTRLPDTDAQYSGIGTGATASHVALALSDEASSGTLAFDGEEPTPIAVVICP
jgi:hypothetical protein